MVRRLCSEEFRPVVRLSIENHVDIRVPRFPWIAQQRPGHLLVSGRNDVTQPIQCLPQRESPLLIPGWVSAGVAAAVTTPALDAVRTTPGSTFPDFGFENRRMAFQVLT